ncbi:MAG: tRNA 4-thiouridine(8) synthase ThiI [Deltaproteobacteria bacterium]|nr:tRNA 4-thiouridine(8) synthase ThiI [Deltaproteobacteria bacterium]
MNLNKKKVRALGLCSGGLDSILAALVLKKQGIAVEWITFETPFFSAEKALKASEMTGIPITVRQITSTYLEMLKNPRCGYGKNMNPCLDCHALMFRLAGEVMKSKGMDFLFSGEVMGQRPMSQTKPSLRYVEKHSGFDGYILRPLSAKRLPETIPEKQGLVNRELLLDLSGRSRKPQIQLAAEFKIVQYPAPAGGCLLTDKIYSIRLKDLIDHGDSDEESDYHLLKYGRHFRLNRSVKLVVGRTRKENEQLFKLYRPETDFILKTCRIPGPVVFMPYGGSSDDISLAACICASYSKAGKGISVDVQVTTPDGQLDIKGMAALPDEFRHLMV